MIPDGFHAVQVARTLDLPVAGIAWGDDVHAWPEKSEYCRDRLIDVLKDVDLRIACSHRLVEDATAWLPNGGDNWSVVYAGVDLDRFSPARDRSAARTVLRAQVRGELPTDAPVLLMAGQPVPEKGYFELLNVWNEVASVAPAWHLVMIGGTGSLDIPRLIDRMGLARAHWIGLQPAERMPDLMRGADAFVLPSHNEGLSLSVLESLATGLPTIATDVGGHSEVIRSDNDGWLIPARNAEALRASLLQMTTNAGERQRRATGSRKAAERIGSPGDNAAKLLTVLRELVARKAGIATMVT
jgi:glycosyltransferase involved in cell wall biosynthesis